MLDIACLLRAQVLHCFGKFAQRPVSGDLEAEGARSALLRQAGEGGESTVHALGMHQASGYVQAGSPRASGFPGLAAV